MALILCMLALVLFQIPDHHICGRIKPLPKLIYKTATSCIFKFLRRRLIVSRLKRYTLFNYTIIYDPLHLFRYELINFSSTRTHYVRLFSSLNSSSPYIFLTTRICLEFRISKEQFNLVQAVELNAHNKFNSQLFVFVYTAPTAVALLLLSFE